MNFIKGIIIGAAAGYAYASNVPKERQKEQMDRIVGQVKQQTKPVTEAISANVQSVADSATKRTAKAVDDVGEATENKLDDDTATAATTTRTAPTTTTSAGNGSTGPLKSRP